MSSKVNEFGDRIKKSDVCAGIMFWVGVAALTTCFFYRGCQEINRHKTENSNKAKIIQIQNQR